MRSFCVLLHITAVATLVVNVSIKVPISAAPIVTLDLPGDEYTVLSVTTMADFIAVVKSPPVEVTNATLRTTPAPSSDSGGFPVQLVGWGGLGLFVIIGGVYWAVVSKRKRHPKADGVAKHKDKADGESKPDSNDKADFIAKEADSWAKLIPKAVSMAKADCMAKPDCMAKLIPNADTAEIKQAPKRYDASKPDTKKPIILDTGPILKVKINDKYLKGRH
jgi:hypothetical protein